MPGYMGEAERKMGTFRMLVLHEGMNWEFSDARHSGNSAVLIDEWKNKRKMEDQAQS